MEKESGLPVSPFYDRATTFVPSAQLGFIDFICLPIFEAFDAFVEIKCITNSKSDL
jgi:cAMP-specific phosphodiesterase 4